MAAIDEFNNSQDTEDLLTRRNEPDSGRLRRAFRRGKSPEPTQLSADQIWDKYRKGMKAIAGELQEYWLNRSFLLGQQWIFWNDQTRRLDALPDDPDRVRLTINRLWPASRITMSKAVSKELVFEVPPSAADDEAIMGAKIGESILHDVTREHDWEGKREDFLWATWIGGTAAIALDWDASALPVLGLDDETGRAVGMGDTVETVLTLADFVVEPGVAEAEVARWWIKARALPPSEVKATYRLSKDPAPDATAALTPYQRKLVAEHFRPGSGESHVDLTMVLTYYERPNPERPQGQVCTVVGKEMVDGPYPWPFKFVERLNLVVAKETRVNNRWTGETVFSIARPVQVAFNAAMSSIVEHMKLTGNARLAVPQSVYDQIEELTDLPGEYLPFPDGTQPPQYVSPPGMPQWWVQQPEMLSQQIDDILGVHAISRGEAPRNVESGLGLQVLAEQDTTPVGRLVKEHAHAFSRLATMVLQTYEAKITAPREARIKIPGQPPDTVNWSGKSLAGQTTAVVPLDAVQPRSRAALQVFAEKAMQMGLIKTLQDFAKVAEIPGSRDLLEAVEPDIARARRENYYLAQGRGDRAIPEPWDDHKKHIHEHNNLRRSQKFDMLPDQVKDLVAMHIQGHETIAAEELGAQVAKGEDHPILAAAPTANESPALDMQDAAKMQSAPPEQGGEIGGNQPFGDDPGGIPLPEEPMRPPEGGPATIDPMNTGGTQ